MENFLPYLINRVTENLAVGDPAICQQNNESPANIYKIFYHQNL